MSLVAKIHHPSPISNWFAERHNDTINKIINEANQKLGHTPIQTNSPHRGFIKAIGLYALLRHFGYVNNRYWLKDTYAETYISKSKLDGLFDEYFKPHDKIPEEAIACVIAASLDLSYRNSHEHEFVKPFIRALRSGTEVKTDKKWASEWTSTIDEASVIVGNIARCCQSRGLKSDEVILNPLFDLSNRIGGAQADLIVGRTIVSTIADTHFTERHFNELVSYVLLDTDNAYSIQELVWLFPLRRSAIFIPVCELFHNVQKTRNEFEILIEESYQIDDFNASGDGIDLMKYSSKYC